MLTPEELKSFDEIERNLRKDEDFSSKFSDRAVGALSSVPPPKYWLLALSLVATVVGLIGALRMDATPYGVLFCFLFAGGFFSFLDQCQRLWVARKRGKRSRGRKKPQESFMAKMEADWERRKRESM